MSAEAKNFIAGCAEDIIEIDQRNKEFDMIFSARDHVSDEESLALADMKEESMGKAAREIEEMEEGLARRFLGLTP